MAATTSPFRLPVTDLLKRAGSSRAVTVSGPLAMSGPGAEVTSDTPVSFDGTLEHVSDGIVVRGKVHARWDAVCSRCLVPLSGEIDIQASELFEPHPLAGETYPLDDEIVDLELLLRDALALELPVAPVCREDCAGLCANCGIDKNVASCDCTTEQLDPRWAALRSLDI